MSMPAGNLPLSRFETKPLEEYEPGTLLIVAGWRKEPKPLCLGIRVGGLKDGGTEHAAALLLQGSSYSGDRDEVGELVTAAQLENGRVLGAKLPLAIEVGADVDADTSGRRSLRIALGMIALGGFGVRIIGGGWRQHGFGWGVAIDPNTWRVDEAAERTVIAALVEKWTLVVSGPIDCHVPVTAPALESYR
jgi:hypothetical protein